MNKEIKGDTTTVEIIPIGENALKYFSETGAVKNWAPALAPSEEEIMYGKPKALKTEQKFPNNRIPARAP